jgi:predicted amidohydrolase
MISKPVCTLKFRSEGRSYEANLDTLVSLLDRCPEGAIVVAHEVCLTNFDYDRFEAAAAFAGTADAVLREHTKDRTLIVTMIERRDDGIYNVAKAYHRGEVVHEQAKAKLFLFGGEHEWFAFGKEEEITVFEIDGIRMGILICFELRFTPLWQRLRGAEIVAIPAQWGKLRAEHFDILGKALALANECYVLQSDTFNEEMCGLSGIVTPFGACERNGDREILTGTFEMSEVKKMRRYLDIGIR